MLAVAANGGPASGTQHTIRSVNFVWKYVSPRCRRSRQSFWSTPTSHENDFSGLMSGFEKPGKNRSLNVGARKPLPALPCRRVPHSFTR
jgi:hypothetical protein